MLANININTMNKRFNLLLLAILIPLCGIKAENKITIGVIQYDWSDIDKSFKELHDSGFGSCPTPIQPENG